MLADTAVLTERDIVAAMPQRPGPARRDPLVETAARTLADDVGLLEREQIERVLQEVRGNKTEAARRLGLSRRTLYRKLAALRPGSSRLDAT
jgi:DNA-binding NtrC family response regulator